MTFISGTARSNKFPLEFSWPRWLISDAYDTFECPPVKRLSEMEVELKSSPVACCVYSNDQVFAMLRMLGRHNFSITSPTVNIGTASSQTDWLLDLHEPTLEAYVFMLWSLLDRHPGTIFLAKKWPLIPRVHINEAKVGYVKRTTTQASYSNTQAFEFNLEAKYPVGDSRDVKTVELTDLPPTVLWHPATAWMMRGALRAALKYRHRIEGLNLRPILIRNDLEESLRAWIEVKKVLSNKFSDVYGYMGEHLNQIDELILRGGWTSMGKSFIDNWSLTRSSISNHGQTLIPWEKYLSANSNYPAISFIPQNVREIAERIQENTLKNIREKNIHYGIGAEHINA